MRPRIADETGEGYSIPAQREACVRHIAERGWNLGGEFTDADESARTADRPMLKALLYRVAEGVIGAVVVHKIDRLARSMEHHVAIRAALRHAGVQLVSVTENIEGNRHVWRLHVRAARTRQEACLAFECVGKTNAKDVDSAKRALVRGLEKATDPDVPEELLDLGVLSAAGVVVGDCERAIPGFSPRRVVHRQEPGPTVETGVQLNPRHAKALADCDSSEELVRRVLAV